MGTEDATFASWLRGALDVRGMSQTELSGRSGVSESTISRVLSAEQLPRRSTLDRLEAPLVGAGSASTEPAVQPWVRPTSPEARRARGNEGAEQFPRHAIGFLRTEALADAVVEAEYRRYCAAIDHDYSFAAYVPATVPKSVQVALGDRRPIDTDTIDAVAESFGVRRTWRTPSSRSDLVRLTKWCRAIRDATVEQIVTQGNRDESKLRSLSNLSAYLSADALRPSLQQQATLEYIFLLCGRRDHQSRTQVAVRLFARTNTPPHLVIMGASPHSRSQSVLSEPHAAAHYLRNHLARDGRVEPLTIDPRADSFLDAAALSVGYLRTLSKGARPTQLAVVAGPYSTLRAAWGYEQAINASERVRAKVFAAAAEQNDGWLHYSGDARNQTVTITAMYAELEKFILGRATGRY